MQTDLYICPHCCAIEFSIPPLDGDQECCKCGHILIRYPGVDTLSRLFEAAAAHVVRYVMPEREE